MSYLMVWTIRVAVTIFFCLSCSAEGDKKKVSPKKQDNSEERDSTDDVLQPRYDLVVLPNAESIQKSVVDQYCLSCHKGSNAQRNLDLTDISAFVPNILGQRRDNRYSGRLIIPGEPQFSSFYIALAATPDAKELMPPTSSGLPPVSAPQQQAVKAWIQAMTKASSTEPTDGDDCAPPEPCNPEPE
jgi:hypothetical protein